MLNFAEFSQHFTKGAVLQSGGDPARKNASRLQITDFDGEHVWFKPIGALTEFRLSYAYIDLLLTHFDEIDPKSIQNTVNSVRRAAGLGIDTTTENYAYGFAKALRSFRQSISFLCEGEVQPPSDLQRIAADFSEGKRIAVLTDRIERDPSARTACISHYGATCQACSFNFEEHYGEIGKGYIHVHHVELISLSDGEHAIDPLRDLVPLCPNCHAMVHTQSPPITIDQLKKILRQRAARV